MNTPTLTQKEILSLKILAVLGFLGPNGVFVYFFLTDPAATRSALTNPISLVFIVEAFFLMFLFAWLLGRCGVRKPSALGFVLLSLVGSLAFSVPAALALIFRRKTGE